MSPFSECFALALLRCSPPPLAKTLACKLETQSELLKKKGFHQRHPGVSQWNKKNILKLGKFRLQLRLRRNWSRGLKRLRPRPLSSSLGCFSLCRGRPQLSPRAVFPSGAQASPPASAFPLLQTGSSGPGSKICGAIRSVFQKHNLEGRRKCIGCEIGNGSGETRASGCGRVRPFQRLRWVRAAARTGRQRGRRSDVDAGEGFGTTGQQRAGFGNRRGVEGECAYVRVLMSRFWPA